MAKQYVWNSEKEEFELVDVYEGVLAEFDRQDKAAAQQGAQSDVACACGHQWLSHNDNGCCWDDECQCTRPAANANSV